jgi:cell division protease FtsH
VLFVIVLFILTVLSTEQNPSEINYSDLLVAIQENNIKTITLIGQKATVEFRDNPYPDVRTNKFEVFIPDVKLFMEEVSGPVKEKKITLKVLPEPTPPWWVSILPTLGVLVFFIFNICNLRTLIIYPPPYPSHLLLSAEHIILAVLLTLRSISLLHFLTFII